MKKVLYMSLVCLCILLCSCDSGRKESREIEQKEQEQEKEEKNKQNEQGKEEGQYVEVVDVTGENRQLRLGEVDVGDVGYEFSFLSFASDYSQVLDGHYYYLRTDGEGNYTVYRDKGEKIICFEVEEDCYVENFVKYGEKFYAFLRSIYDDMINNLVSVDAGTGEVAVVKNMTKETADNGLREAVIYRDFLYYEDYSDYYKEYDFWENSYYVKPEVGKGRLARISLSDGLKETSFPLSSRIESLKENPLLTFIDGKVYYGEQQNREVVLFSYDLENNVEKEIFRYETFSTWEINIKMDKDYLYSQDRYMIPREGGKMMPVSEGIYSWVLSTDGKYMFYLDKKDQIHRINRKKHKDVVICNDISAIDEIDCTGDGIYVREYNKAEDEWEEEEVCDNRGDPRSNNLYYMDFDGKNRKKIWKDITEENGDFVE